MRTEIILGLACAALAAACENEEKGGAASATASAARAPTATATAKPSASATASAAPKPAVPCKYADYSGPKQPAKALESKKAWGVVPVGTRPEDCALKIVKNALLDYDKPAGDLQLLHDNVGGAKNEFLLPPALVHAAEAPKGVKKGDLVMCNVAAASGYCRVTDINDKQVKGTYVWVSSASEVTLEPSQIVKLDDKLGFGQPIGVKSGKDWDQAVFVTSDATDTWYIAATGAFAKAASKDVKPMKVQKHYKKGDKVWAAKIHLDKAKIVSALKDDAGYEVEFEGEKGKTAKVRADQVTSPL